MEPTKQEPTKLEPAKLEKDNHTNENNKQAMRVMWIFAAMLIFVIAYAVYSK